MRDYDRSVPQELQEAERRYSSKMIPAIWFDWDEIIQLIYKMRGDMLKLKLENQAQSNLLRLWGFPLLTQTEQYSFVEAYQKATLSHE